MVRRAFRGRQHGYRGCVSRQRAHRGDVGLHPPAASWFGNVNTYAQLDSRPRAVWDARNTWLAGVTPTLRVGRRAWTMRTRQKAAQGGFHSGCWRRGSESNRRRRLCRPLHDHSATPPGGATHACAKGRANEKGEPGALPRETGAGKESRTPDLNLGKVALYQLSYSRAG